MSSLIPQSSQQMIPEARAFRASLRGEEQAAFDELYRAAQQNYAMMETVGLVIPLEKMLFAMLIEQQKQIKILEQEVDLRWSREGRGQLPITLDKKGLTK